MEVIVEEAAVVVEEEVVAAGEAGAAAAAEEVAAAAAEAAEEEVVVVATMMAMTMMMGHLSVYQVPPIVEQEEGFSAIKKWNNNSLKSYKINDRWPQDDGSPPSRPRIRMDAVLP